MKRPTVPSYLPWTQVGGGFLLSLLLMGAQIKGGELVLQEAVAYRAEGRRYQQVGSLHSAVGAYQKAIVANPSYSDAYNDLGIVLESLGNLSEAEKAYKTALRLNPRLVGVDSNLALLYEKSGRMDDAAAHWTARVKSGPPNDPWVNKAREKLKSYHFPVPEDQAKRPAKVSLPPELTDAKAFAQQLAKEKAKTAEQKAKMPPPKTKEVSSKALLDEADRIAKELAKAKANEFAQEKANQKKKVAPPPPPVPPAPESKLLTEKLTKEKEESRRRSIQELIQRGLSSMRQGRYAEAVIHYQQTLVLDPDNAEADQGLKRAQAALAKSKGT